MDSFFWHDYETWGVDPAVDRPAQFAGIRTDLDLNPIDDPIMLYAKPPRDCLVQPQAVMVTGITPQLAEKEGLVEYEFIRKIRQHMMQPGTCSAGYNSIRFDDEVTRNSLYRNFFDPYEREYKKGNSRWDLIDVVRLCYALRPEGFVWPKDEEGRVSFRLEKLTEANGIEQQGAHDALVDVKATISLAKKIKTLQPKLFDYALSLNNKHTVSRHLKVGTFTPIFHVSSMFSSSNHCCSIVLPIAYHPTNKNEVICFDLRHDPQTFFDINREERLLRQFSSKAALEALAKERGEEEIERLPLKNIHINKSPMIAPVNILDDSLYERLAIDAKQARANMELIKNTEQVTDAVIDLFSGNNMREHEDPDRMIYSGGFFNEQDKMQFNKIHKTAIDALNTQHFDFCDARLPEMFFRFRARNFPESLSVEETEKWKRFCYDRITQPNAGSSICLTDYKAVIAELFDDAALSEDRRNKLQDLESWAKSLIS